MHSPRECHGVGWARSASKSLSICPRELLQKADHTFLIAISVKNSFSLINQRTETSHDGIITHVPLKFSLNFTLLVQFSLSTQTLTIPSRRLISPLTYPMFADQESRCFQYSNLKPPAN